MLQGQWYGTYNGSNIGSVILNLDRRGKAYSGHAAVIEDTPGLPSATYYTTISSPDSEGHVTGHMDLDSYFEKATNMFIPPRELATRYPELGAQATRIKFTGRFQASTLKISFESNAETAGTAELVFFPKVQKETTVRCDALEWHEFKTQVGTEEMRRWVFRGQPNPDPLRTSFHRADRYDIARFAREDVGRLASAIMSVTDFVFDIGDPHMHAALLGIAQHHGFPTPLLDWSRSPYVAAYFACRDAIVRPDRKISPTIFAFNEPQWRSNYRRIEAVNVPMPELALINPLPLKNPRLTPQQSILMFTNVDNLEDFIKTRERDASAPYLKGYALKTSPATILRDLRSMGVYAGSLFPGLDGVCRGVFEDEIEND